MTTVLSSNDQFVPPVLVKFIIVFRANALNDLEKAQNLFRKAVEKAIPAAVDARVERNAKTKQFQLVKDVSNWPEEYFFLFFIYKKMYSLL